MLSCTRISGALARKANPSRGGGAKPKDLLEGRWPGCPKGGHMSEREHTGVPTSVLAEDLYAVETYFTRKGVSEFVYDEKLDVFRFPEDGRFAFCREFADRQRLQERGYLTFYSGVQ
jgi:hypothetical protein